MTASEQSELSSGWTPPLDTSSFGCRICLERKSLESRNPDHLEQPALKWPKFVMFTILKRVPFCNGFLSGLVSVKRVGKNQMTLKEAGFADEGKKEVGEENSSRLSRRWKPNKRPPRPGGGPKAAWSACQTLW